MNTEFLFRSKPYEKSCFTKVLEITSNGGVRVDCSVFFPRGGGQPGDSGNITWNGGMAPIQDTINTLDGGIELILEDNTELPPVGAVIKQELNWSRRFKHMQTHTALHLLSVVIPLPVTSGSIAEEKGRLDFDMPEPITNRDQIESQLNELVAKKLPVLESWITDEELEDNPSLVKTMSVKPPIGSGKVRLIRIGIDDEQVDLQPCGGTHVANTQEIGRIRLGKVEKKGRHNRRVNIILE